MKYDLSKKTNRFAERTLEAFRDAMLTLLSEKSFEEISVNRICAISNYPRATFYNYFEDKYDLLNYCWDSMSSEIRLNDYLRIQPEKRLYEIFDRMHDFLEEHEEQLQRIIKCNSLEGAMEDSFQKYMKTTIREIMNRCQGTDNYGIPCELVAEHYSNTIFLILKWKFLRKNTCSRQEAHEYLRCLLEVPPWSQSQGSAGE